MKVRNANGVELDVTPRLETFEIAVPAASSSVLDSAKRVTLSANTAGRAAPGIVLEWIAARGIISTDVDITIDGVDWQQVAFPLPPQLWREVGALGEQDHGIQVTIRNRRLAAVTVVLAVRGDANVREETLAGEAITTPLPDVGGRPPYYDRNGATQQSVYANASTAVHADTERWTYTVPAAKKALFESAFVAIIQQTAAAAAGWAAIRIRIGGITFITADLVTNAIGSKDGYTIGPVGFLPPGTVVDCRSFDLKADGTTILRGVARLTLFDF